MIAVGQWKRADANRGRQAVLAHARSDSLAECHNRDSRHQANHYQHGKVDERLWTDRPAIDARGFGQTEVDDPLPVQSVYDVGLLRLLMVEQIGFLIDRALPLQIDPLDALYIEPGDQSLVLIRKRGQALFALAERRQIGLRSQQFIGQTAM